MSLADAFIEPEAAYKAAVMFQTWGHLEAKRGAVHKGYFVFSIAAYGGFHVILDADWKDLDDSPELHAAMLDYVFMHGKRGKVFRLEGHVRRFKNGNYQIGGLRRVVKLKS